MASGASKTASTEISAADVLACSGEDELALVRDVVLRGNDPPFTGIRPECAARLRALELLSLSRNKLSSLRTLRPLQALTELNLNFNEIGPTLFGGGSSSKSASSASGGSATEAPFSLPVLRRLYLSKNRLESLSGLAGCYVGILWLGSRAVSGSVQGTRCNNMWGGRRFGGIYSSKMFAQGVILISEGVCVADNR